MGNIRTTLKKLEKEKINFQQAREELNNYMSETLKKEGRGKRIKIYVLIILFAMITCLFGLTLDQDIKDGSIYNYAYLGIFNTDK